jgi:hypothetical protein
VTIQILAFAVRASAGIGGDFVILDFLEPEDRPSST